MRSSSRSFLSVYLASSLFHLLSLLPSISQSRSLHWLRRDAAAEPEPDSVCGSLPASADFDAHVIAAHPAAVAGSVASVAPDAFAFASSVLSFFSSVFALPSALSELSVFSDCLAAACSVHAVSAAADPVDAAASTLAQLEVAAFHMPCVSAFGFAVAAPASYFADLVAADALLYVVVAEDNSVDVVVVVAPENDNADKNDADEASTGR